jgi:hypothetical protein
MMVHIVAESEDWPRHNWYLAHRRATNGLPGTKFIYSVWDQELTLDRLVRRNRINVGNGADGAGELYSPARVYAQLRAWPEFRRQFGDRVHKHLFNGGALTPSNNVARLLAPAAIIREALIGESARWGDARKTGVPAGQIGTGVTFTRNEWWQPEIDKLATNFFQKLTIDNIARFRAGSLYPNLGAPAFNQFGGAVAAGFGLLITHTNAGGVIYYTTDGTDPRTYGTGAVSPGAQAYGAPVVLNSPTAVRARVLNAGLWSALVEAVFYPPQDLSKLALTEIMYHPPNVGATNGDEFEFIEIKNTGTNPLNLTGLRFFGAISFAFPNGTTLAPGAFFVIAPNAALFASKYPGVALNGVYAGKLDNGGESLNLSHALGAKVFSVTFGDEAPWPAAADGFGFSIVPKRPGATQAPDAGSDWRASSGLGGSPGADDPEPALPPVVINEVLAASIFPDVDRIELFNPTASPVNVGGWFLTDAHSIPKKFRIPDGTTIPAGGYVTFNETQFNPTGEGVSFSLSSSGESIHLFSADASTNLTGYSHGFAFDAAEPGVSFGRYVNSVGEEQFPAQLVTSLQSANAGPRVGPIVINEIYYNPAAGGDEFIELANVTATSLPLFDPAAPTNTWRLTGLDYTFPTNAFIGSNGFLVLVATNPASFRAKYSVPMAVPILGPYAGVLQDSGERLKLQRAIMPDTNTVAFSTVDEVRYNDKAPWPPGADGGGLSLQRRNAAAYGNDPINWDAAIPTPGRPYTSPDTDGDGLPDSWEVDHQTDPLTPDADADPDHDDATNLEEYLAGTDPQSPQSRLEVEASIVSPGLVRLRFVARANHGYTVLYKNSLDAPAWVRLRDEPPGSQERMITIEDSIAGSTNRFYRIVTPQAP